MFISAVASWQSIPKAIENLYPCSESTAGSAQLTTHDKSVIKVPDTLALPKGMRQAYEAYDASGRLQAAILGDIEKISFEKLAMQLYP